MKWTQIAAREPALGTVLHDRLIKPGVVLVGTTRRDGTARISGVEPLVLDGELWLSMMRSSAKVRDLERDPRLLLHSIVTGPEAGTEVKVRGTARPQPSPEVQQTYAGEVARQLGWRPVVGEFALFAVDVVDVTVIGYDTESGAQYVARWPEGREFLRPSTTPTSLGPPEPVRRLLSPALG
jgi:Pyridoxamine 5'-phosphate oxidase